VISATSIAYLALGTRYFLLGYLLKIDVRILVDDEARRVVFFFFLFFFFWFHLRFGFVDGIWMVPRGVSEWIADLRIVRRYRAGTDLSEDGKSRVCYQLVITGALFFSRLCRYRILPPIDCSFL